VAEAGAVAEGNFELVNCGDEATTITLDIEIDINGDVFPIGGIEIPLGAGEILSQHFIIPVPPPAAGWTVTICVTATSGTAQAADCATLVVLGTPPPASRDQKSLTFQMSSSDDCVEVDLELPDTIVAGPESFGEGYFELTNCGDEAATVYLDITLDLPDTSVSMTGIPVNLGAGETISKSFTFPVPPIVPNGTYVICVTTTAGTAMSSACQTVVIVGGLKAGSSEVGLSNYPNPFNPSTTISFEVPVTSRVNLSIYNVLGQKIITLKDEVMAAGPYEVEWNGTDENGRSVSTGIYFYRLTVGDDVVSKKMMLIK
jgi:hypothetical protein